MAPNATAPPASSALLLLDGSGGVCGGVAVCSSVAEERGRSRRGCTVRRGSERCVVEWDRNALQTPAVLNGGASSCMSSMVEVAAGRVHSCWQRGDHDAAVVVLVSAE